MTWENRIIAGNAEELFLSMMRNAVNVSVKRDKEKMPMSEWFTIDHIDNKTHIISEYKHWEETMRIF